MLGDIVHHCPYCELRFTLAAEVKDHVLHDHPEHSASVAGADATAADRFEYYRVDDVSAPPRHVANVGPDGGHGDDRRVERQNDDRRGRRWWRRS